MRVKNPNKGIIKNLYKSEKIRFLYYGSINTFFTNLILQLFLLFSEVYIATLISQLFNILLGFFIYKNKVFRKDFISRKKLVFYLLTALGSWNLNWTIISSFSDYFNISKNLAAFLTLPIIALWSYLIQKLIVFN